MNAMSGIDQSPSDPADALGVIVERVATGLPSLMNYLGTRTADPAAFLLLIIPMLPPTAWMPITDRLSDRCGLSPCRFDSTLLMRLEDCTISAIIVGDKWSVTLGEYEASIDIQCPSDHISMRMEGRTVRNAMDVPFLAPNLIIRHHARFGEYVRFYCSMA